MSLTIAVLIASLAAYAVGSVPSAFLAAKFTLGIDIRQQGSGNVGATNVARVLGAKWGILVLLLDCLKGLLPVLLLPPLLLAGESPEIGQMQVASGLAAVLGHIFPCWLGFRGGKGVATALGVGIIIGPIATMWALAVFAISFLASRIVALASMLAAIVFAVAELWWLQPNPFSHENWSRAAFSLFVPLLILVRHRTNLARLMHGEESQFCTAETAHKVQNSNTSGEQNSNVQTPLDG